MARLIDRAEVEALAGMIGAQLAAIDAGDMDAPKVLRERLVGALAAVRIVLGDDPADVLAQLSGDQV